MIKHFLSVLFILPVLWSCGSSNSQKQKQSDTLTAVIPFKETVVNKSPISEILDSYLQMKNALVKDNSTDASDAGIKMQNALKSFNRGSLTDEQTKKFEELSVDATEHAVHISESKGNIKHQREHFEMLSNDMYDLVKSFGAGQVLYREFCPMYNNGKGAFWLSEKKEIQNPYYGNEMLTCGVVKEELN